MILVLVGCAQWPGLMVQSAGWERIALSPSPFTNIMLEQGNVYVDHEGRRAVNLPSLIRLYQAHGASEVYARIASSSVPRWG